MKPEIIEKIIELVWDKSGEGWNGEYMPRRTHGKPLVTLIDPDGELRRQISDLLSAPKQNQSI